MRRAPGSIALVRLLFAFFFVIALYLIMSSEQPNSKVEETNIRKADPIIMAISDMPVVKVDIEESKPKQKQKKNKSKKNKKKEKTKTGER